MATKINGLSEPAKRQDSFRVAPDDVKTGTDARIVPASNQDELDAARAYSIAVHGQQQPIPVRKLKDGTLETIAGNTRHRAVKLWRKGFKGPDGRFYHNPEATIWVVVENGVSDYDAFVRGIVENVERNDMTDVQEAEACRVLREVYKKTDTEIAAIFGRTNTNRVAALRKLLEQPPAVVKLVQDGKLALYAALDLAAVPEAEREQVLAKATSTTGKVDGAAIRKALQTQDDDATGTEDDDGVFPLVSPTEAPAATATKKAVVKRTVKNFKDFVKDAEANVDQTHQPLLKKLAAWFDGKCGDKALWKVLNDYTWEGNEK